MTTKRPCPYDDPNCTGVHVSSARKAEMCPSAYSYKRAYVTAQRTGEEFQKRRIRGACPHNDSNCTGNHKSGSKVEMCPSAYANKSELQRGYTSNRTKRIQALKLERGCIDCGYSAHSEALDFDHRPGVEKLFTIGESVTRSWETVLAEIAKCDVRCANCHRIITAERRKDDAA